MYIEEDALKAMDVADEEERQKRELAYQKDQEDAWYALQFYPDDY